jgi:hypothetical protein
MLSGQLAQRPKREIVVMTASQEPRKGHLKKEKEKLSCQVRNHQACMLLPPEESNSLCFEAHEPLNS